MWKWFSRIADVSQVGTLLVGSGIVTVGVAAIYTYASQVSPPILIAALFVVIAVGIWAVNEFSQRKTTGRIAPAERPDVDRLELLERKFEVNKVFARVRGKVVELEIDAYDYYVELADEQKRKIDEITYWALRYQFWKRDFVDVVDPRKRIRNKLNDFISEGNEIARRVRDHDCLISKVPYPYQIGEWEIRVRDHLRIEAPDREADFMRPVDLKPGGHDVNLHQIGVRLERLSRILHEI